MGTIIEMLFTLPSNISKSDTRATFEFADVKLSLVRKTHIIASAMGMPAFKSIAQKDFILYISN